MPKILLNLGRATNLRRLLKGFALQFTGDGLALHKRFFREFCMPVLARFGPAAGNCDATDCCFSSYNCPTGFVEDFCRAADGCSHIWR